MRLGLPYAEFWDLSLREVDLVSRAQRKRLEDEVARERVLNQERASLMAFAFHKPAKMPDYTKPPKAQDAPTRAFLEDFVRKVNAARPRKRRDT